MDRRLQISQILLKQDKTVSWLKTELSSKYPSVDFYHLLSDKSKNFDADLYDDIILLFKKKGFITSASEQCEKFADNLIQLNAIIGHSTFLINTNAVEFMKDNVLDVREKMKLLKIIDKTETECVVSFDKIREVIERGPDVCN